MKIIGVRHKNKRLTWISHILTHSLKVFRRYKLLSITKLDSFRHKARSIGHLVRAELTIDCLVVYLAKQYTT